MDANRRVVITGMGVISPIGIGVEQFWSNAVAGVSGVKRISAFNPDGYMSQIAGEVTDFDPAQFINPKDIKKMDRFIHFAVTAADMAIQHARLDSNSCSPARIGVFIASGVGGLGSIEREHEVLLNRGSRRVSPFLVPMLIINLASGQVAMKHNFQGPNLAIATACASALHAIGESWWIIKRGDADIMVTGGSESVITPLAFAAFGNMRALSTRNDDPSKASRPFDVNRDGFVLGEGSGVLVIESLDSALKRNVPILAEIVGYGLNNDAYHITAPREDGSTISTCMKLALNSAQLEPSQIDYVNAHGTSTPLNDLIETRALHTVFGEAAHSVPISSTKSMIGHLLGAAGGVELIATCLTAAHGIIHPTINLETPDPECDLDYVPLKARSKPVRYAMCNSFGFGGTNAVIIVKRWE